jgi:hypothetical protein
VLDGREVFLCRNVLEGQQIREFWCFFILTPLAGKPLNQGHLKQVLLHIIPFTEHQGQVGSKAVLYSEGPMMRSNTRDWVF